MGDGMAVVRVYVCMCVYVQIGEVVDVIGPKNEYSGLANAQSGSCM